MRRKEKEIVERSEIEGVIAAAKVCRLAMADNGHPYVVPLCFGYADDVLYFHSAKEGKKLDILKKNNRVCFEFDIDAEIKIGKTACEWGMKFRSVIGIGRAYFIDDSETKRSALDKIMAQYSSDAFEYPDKAVDKTIVIRVEIESMTGKRAG